MNRVLLRNGTLIDGTGAPPVPGDLLIVEEQIAEVGRFAPPQDVHLIDCTDLTVSPGFIDCHSHSDLQVLENRREKAQQGVTTEVVGNCGFSAYPAPAERKLLHDFANGIFCGDDRWGWTSAQGYLQAVEQATPMVNVGSLVGHGSLRIALVGPKLGPLAPADLNEMARRLEQAISEGAMGLSTGLMYAPGSSAPLEELECLCRVVAQHNKVYATHIRSYTSGLVNAVEEQIGLAKRSGCKLQISHLQAAGEHNWPLQAEAIERIEKARAAGIDVAFDCYPYEAGSTVLTQLLPQWALEGGLEAMLARLSNRAERTRIATETLSGLENRWANIYIASVGSQTNVACVSRNIETIAQLRDCEPVEVVLDLLREERGVVNIISFNQSDENLRQTLTHPLSIVASDGVYVKGRPHPRLLGTFPCLLGKICRGKKWLTLAEAVRKITDLPARTFGISKRGRLERGYFADITVFDATTITSSATYETPEVKPVGIRHVFHNGRQTVSA